MGDESSGSQKMLLYAIDKSMKSVFGDSTADAVYYYLQKRFLLTLDDIPEKPQAFMNAIKEIFGETGADIVEALLVKDLCERSGIKEQKRTSKLGDCFIELRVHFMKNNKNLKAFSIDY